MEINGQNKSRKGSNKSKNPFLRFIDQTIHFRYIIGVLLLIVIVIFNLNGSSIGNWDRIVSERSDNKKTDIIQWE